jgi:transposase
MSDGANNSCSRCLELELQVAALIKQNREIELLKKQVGDLQKKLEEKARARKRQAAPFRGRKKNANDKQKPGRKPGHQAETRPDPTPDQIDRTLVAPVDICPSCQTALDDVVTHVQYQTDIPPVQPAVTQFNVQVGFCSCCQKRVQGVHPEQTSQALGAANHSLGPRLIGTAADMKYRLGIPYRKIADFFQYALGITCSPSTLCRVAGRLAKRSVGLLEVLKLQIAGRAVVHVDETGWWLGGDAKYLHVFGVDDIVIFQVGGRGNDIALKILGEHFQGLVACDGYVAYDIFNTVRCNAHPIRRVRDLLEAGVSDQPALTTIQQLLLGGLSLRDRRDTLTTPGYGRLVTMHKQKMHDWIEAHRENEDEAIGRLARHLGKYETEFLRYLDAPHIPATNNFAEGLLRFAVVLRKVGCCNRTERGARTFETLSSLLATFRRRGLNFIAWVTDFMTGAGPKYVPPDLLPPKYPYQILLTE